EQYSVFLLHALMAVETPHQWRLYAPGPPPDDLRPLPLQWEWQTIPFPRLWTHLRLAWAMACHRPDVLFVPAHVVPIIHPRATVVTIHDLGYRRFPEAHTARSRRYLDWSTRWSVRAARRVIAVSGATRDDLVTMLKVPNEKITVVHHGVRPITARPPDAAVQATLARLGISRPYVLFLGTIQPRKNLQQLIRAFRQVVDAGLPQTLVIAGRMGWLAEPIRAAVTAGGLAGRVHFAGYVADDDLPALYTGADAFTLPSLAEGFGMPALEALAYGVPVVASATTSLPEIVGDAGLLVDPLDEAALGAAVVRALTDNALRARLAKAGPARAAQFSWERCARETLAVLEGAAR
ncbi:MAG: glycosyltransferase family 4 protein, partial [Thermomicrobia bacterium]|nr:glycosyltransferase family 4 protein [Thermomicrobia bacterium]MCA1723319.1 glycosyltransferase family 4 protein [Thermomicrobia bacterium]